MKHPNTFLSEKKKKKKQQLPNTSCAVERGLHIDENLNTGIMLHCDLSEGVKLSAQSQPQQNQAANEGSTERNTWSKVMV